MERQEKLWLAATYEALLATQSLIIQRLGIKPKDYPADKRENIKNKMIQSLFIYMFQLDEYLKGGETLIKFSYFLQDMDMKEEFMSILKKFEHKILF